ncbi:1-deoxy-D-xylulose-5-phosphate reductoisomerase [Alkalisalibacterium limincola]|uniref:1-deoxy-D-xylulose 5-phosphate reductoisomerase n=1 Tax=Alkalisalibacterium limincola TaxID=2699169 RepID=A0A5C8KSB8_9GAMM|nr:1-deoxy-D-xylulose-5-phosphate reductoisomerase [Alkalisalibacterium limincola]TXK62157.1 1-deoxy-D-xylulose-5-phosphate reductoisomerase [Alkalisalibacterium limincola]
MTRQRLAILGATGSIGSSTLDVVARHPDRFELTTLSAHSQVDALVALCRRFRPARAVVSDPAAYAALRDGLADAGLDTEAHAGPEALEAAAEAADTDTVVAAIVGAAGMSSTLAAARAGKRILLANKESVVLAGDLLMREIRAHGARVLPVDSEHNAIFQCLPGDPAQRGGVRRVLLTASGGPFRGFTRAQLAGVTPEQACAHPNWSMGRKISVDSATLMNKGLEVIEAHWLFGLDRARIDVVVHPQSIVHSLVDYVDGSMLAQLGQPDMRTALAYGLAWPERIDSGVGTLDLAALGRLDFEAPDHATFPCLGLAYAALAAGGTAPAVLNAANEVAVSAFLQGRAGFLDIPALLQATLDALETHPADSLDATLAADAEARRVAGALLPRLAGQARPDTTYGTP